MAHNALGVRFEGNHRSKTIAGLTCAESFEDFLMSQMNAVERPHGNHRRLGFIPPENLIGEDLNAPVRHLNLSASSSNSTAFSK